MLLPTTWCVARVIESSPMGRCLLVLLAVLACASSGCIKNVTRHVLPPGQAESLDRESPFLKVHVLDGRAYVLSAWSVDTTARMVRGRGDLFGLDREPLLSGDFGVPLDSVALFETNVTRTHGSVMALSIITAGSLVLTLYCAANPKACFGSCPTFYVSDGTRDILQAEGFSGSVAPSLEATDLDALPRARARGRELRIVMRDEALETQVVRRADLLAAPRTHSGRVFATAAGEFFQADRVRGPVRATGPEGSCREALASLDDIERSSPADSTDLGARETIELRFERSGAGRLGVVIAARQSLMSTYLFYQALAWMGRSAGEWFAALERGDAAIRTQARAADGLIGGIEVEVLDASGAWVPAGQYAELGPIATDEQLIRLPQGGADPAQVRLHLTRGAWRINQVALAELGAKVDPVRIPPQRVLHGDADAPVALAALLGAGDPLTTVPGDAYTLVYGLPGEAEEYELFLESRGYYLEWMRREWLTEEDPGQLARLFLDPRGSLRRMAPAFKRQEATMESAFWGSRYAQP